MTPRPGQDLDYFVLGLLPGATEDEVCRAWRDMVRRLHPDICADQGRATQHLARVNAAHDRLRQDFRTLKSASAGGIAGETSRGAGSLPVPARRPGAPSISIAAAAPARRGCRARAAISANGATATSGGAACGTPSGRAEAQLVVRADAAYRAFMTIIACTERAPPSVDRVF